MTKEQTKKSESRKKIIEGVHVVAKPIGPVCNLDCEYCFYKEKEALFSSDEQYCMSDEILSAFITNYITSQPTPVVEFVWQGGEPTLLGLDFYKRVIKLQKPFLKKKTIKNSIQTNGTLLNDEWCLFFHKNNFMVGLSLDGPKEIHDRYRRDHEGKGTFDKVLRGLKLLQKHQVEYNVLVSVARDTASHPLEVYRFLRDQGVEFIQFTPIVERTPDANSQQQGLHLARPASLKKKERQTETTSWSVVPEEYGDFLITVYEEWVHHDVGKIFVMNFEWALNAWIGNPSPVCIHAKQCGRSLVIEHNGDVYACDHCVYPEYRLGNIRAEALTTMAEKSRRLGFGVAKEKALTRWCKECDALNACQGGCPKHRFALSCYDEPGQHYLCDGYRKFFLHIRKYCQVMAQLIENGQSAALITKVLQGPLVIKLN